MNTTFKIVIAAVIGLFVGAAGACAFPENKGDMNNTMGLQHMMPNGQMMGGSMMQGSMDGMMAQLDGKTGDAFDQAFLSEMIMHHEGAVGMAEAALKNAKHQEIKDLSQEIITAQNAEIKQMQDWQKSWYSN